ncbi:NUDIX hydrolase [Gracilibacillus oryzae]|uniref:NUDIX hydrolase n=1 Tax=Gracilibacillus oryzae TaxID=1672701 RepID=A0A7C8GV59_9BACI|nr:NUDIX hydrolase [Gracilibacillus oryzae]KAB8138111.1 NUDIX hydrolase [Gracilibacillus oryzae]
MKTQNNNGFEFLDFHLIEEAEIYNYHRLAGSYAVIKCNGKYLLCYNILRKQWELPAGRREANETPKDCAIRELYEETGQSVTKLEFKGLLKVKNLFLEDIKYNPVYFATIEKLQPFIENKETSDIQLWDQKQEIGDIDAVDMKILDYIN